MIPPTIGPGNTFGRRIAHRNIVLHAETGFLPVQSVNTPRLPRRFTKEAT